MKRLFLLLLITPLISFAQEDLLGELEKSQPEETDYTIATFKGTRLVNGHTIETKNEGSLEFIFQHRFGAINGGFYEMFGLDEAYVRLGLDYGITDRLSASIGRNSVDKTMDGYLKFRTLRQSEGEKSFPFSLTTLGGVAYQLSPKKSEAPENFENVDRLAYVGQFLIARKFTTAFSFQLMPTYIHRNAVDQTREENDQIAIGFGGRLKLTRSVALTTDYYYNISRMANSGYYDAVGFGIDIETGGHVFQLVMTNAIGLTERRFITQTEDDFFDGDIHFGFNVTRTFQLKKNK